LFHLKITLHEKVERGRSVMSGPALRQKEAHHSIHEAARGEAEEMTIALRRAMKASDLTVALETAYVLIEHWETRTLQHAESEETGLYLEIAKQYPQKWPDIVALKRDHALLRILLDEAKQLLHISGASALVLTHFEAMLLVNKIHSREEEEKLLPVEKLAIEVDTERGSTMDPMDHFSDKEQMA
jgi:hypothetical protein